MSRREKVGGTRRMKGGILFMLFDMILDIFWRKNPER